jgi:hypothetical protein
MSPQMIDFACRRRLLAEGSPSPDPADRMPRDLDKLIADPTRGARRFRFRAGDETRSAGAFRLHEQPVGDGKTTA